MSRLIRVSSRALGEPRRVIVHVYESLDEMRAASTRFNGSLLPDAAGVTQAYRTVDGQITVPVVRLTRGWLSTQIVSHEVAHAATGIYGSTLDDDCPVRDVVNHFNEPFARLYSDLMHKVVVALYRHGYYDRTPA